MTPRGRGRATQPTLFSFDNSGSVSAEHTLQQSSMVVGVLSEMKPNPGVGHRSTGEAAPLTPTKSALESSLQSTSAQPALDIPGKIRLRIAEGTPFREFNSNPYVQDHFATEDRAQTKTPDVEKSVQDKGKGKAVTEDDDDPEHGDERHVSLELSTVGSADTVATSVASGVPNRRSNGGTPYLQAGLSSLERIRPQCGDRPLPDDHVIKTQYGRLLNLDDLEFSTIAHVRYNQELYENQEIPKKRDFTFGELLPGAHSPSELMATLNNRSNRTLEFIASNPGLSIAELQKKTLEYFL